MRNQRKKRRDVTESFQNLNSSKRKKNFGFLGNPNNTGDFDDDGNRLPTGPQGSDSFEDLRNDINPRLRSVLDSQVDTIQDAANDRQDAEDSNLDILDRGSRFIRRNSKLKKFKV